MVSERVLTCAVLFLHVYLHMQNGNTSLSAATDKDVVDTLPKYGADPNLTPTLPIHSTVHGVELILLLGGVVCTICAYMNIYLVSCPWLYTTSPCTYVSPTLRSLYNLWFDDGWQAL